MGIPLSETVQLSIPNFKNDLISVELPEVTPEVEKASSQLSDLLSVQKDNAVSSDNPIDSLSSLDEPFKLPRSIGDAVLERLSKIGTEYKVTMERALAAMDKSPNEISQTELMKLTFEVTIGVAHTTLVSGGCQKCVQNLETLTKMT